LFAIEADGSGLRRLTPSGLAIASYEWAPDGSRIAYLDRHGALWLVRPDGTGSDLLAASSPPRSPWYLSWSPDGKAIAVLSIDPAPPRSNDLRIDVVPVDGGKARRLPSGGAQSPDWSPRTDEIIYGAGRSNQIIRSDGSKPRPFFRRPPTTGIRPPTSGVYTPTWSPDGTHVGFGGCRVRRGRCVARYAGIYVADANGTNLHLVTSHAYNEYGFAWSPNGRSIVYGRANRQGIYIIGADGHNNHRLTHDSPRPVDWGALTWAPDGRSIAYSTDRTGNGDIYVIDADGHNRGRLTRSPAIDIDPTWQPQ
jgi:TolB protein